MAGLMTNLLGYGPEMTTHDPEVPAVALPISNPIAPPPAFNMTANSAADFQPATAMAPQQIANQIPAPPAQPSMMMIPEVTAQTRVVDEKSAKLQADAVAAEQGAIRAQAAAQQREDEIRALALSKVASETDAQKQKYADALKEFGDKKVIDPMDKWGTGQKVGAAIAMGLGAFAASYTGGKNHAADIINDSINRDISLQEQEIKRLGSNVDASKNALASLYQRMGDINQAKDVLSMVALAGYEKDIMKLAESAKNEKTKANADSLVAAIRTKQAETASRMNETVVTNTQKAVALGGAGSKPRTSDQDKAYLNYNVMQNAEENLKKVDLSGIGAGGYLNAKMPEATRTEKIKLLDQAARDITGAYLRYTSGAAISESEKKEELAAMIPTIGDSPAVIEQKRRTRAVKLQGMYHVAAGDVGEAMAQGQQRTANQNQTAKVKQQLGFAQ